MPRGLCICPHPITFETSYQLMWQKIQSLIYDRRMPLAAYILAAVVISVQLVSLGAHVFRMPLPGEMGPDIMNQRTVLDLFIGRRLTDYNNYLIFKYSWSHLVQGTNLYQLYPPQHWDYYKYSPAFALCMGLLAWLPDMVGLSVWSLVNVLTLYWAIRMLPFPARTQNLMLWFVLNELITSLSNAQSNGLMAGLFIAAFCCMENGKLFVAALLLAMATYIKVYGIVGCALFLFYPGKWKFIIYSAFWMLFFALVPLVATPWHTLMWQYQNWAALMAADASKATGLSVNGCLQSWFGIMDAGKWVTIAGMLLFLLPFARVRMYADPVFRLLVLASLLLWVVIFNHKAESPTFIIAVAGVGIWFFTQPVNRWTLGLIIFVLLFTSFSTSDVFPPWVRTHFMKPYRFKAFPCILAWVVVVVELLRRRPIAGSPEKVEALGNYKKE